jgi:hypothetical protein
MEPIQPALLQLNSIDVIEDYCVLIFFDNYIFHSNAHYNNAN